MFHFDHRYGSERPVPAREAWDVATTLAGIQSELPGWLRIATHPPVRTLDELLACDEPVTATLHAGPLRAARWQPRIEVLDRDEHRFVERSRTMSVIRDWRHERRVVALTPTSCRIEDRVSGRSLLPGVGPFVGWLFRRRHAGH